jgi:hypothetical protein
MVPHIFQQQFWGFIPGLILNGSVITGKSSPETIGFSHFFLWGFPVKIFP